MKENNMPENLEEFERWQKMNPRDESLDYQEDWKAYVCWCYIFSKNRREAV